MSWQASGCRNAFCQIIVITLRAGGLRIVSDESYMGLGKNLLFTEFTSIPDWHYEAPNFWAFYGALCSA